MYVIFGCGQLGRLAVRGLRSCGIEPLAYCDNNKDLWGRTLDGLRVLSPLEARKQHPGDLFVTAIYNPSRLIQQLAELGLQSITYPDLYTTYCFEEETRFRNSGSPGPAVTSLLADGYSVSEYTSQRYWRIFFDSSVLGLHSDPKDIYFPRHIFQMSDREVFVDCGAYDGDSFVSFTKAVHGCYEKAILVEPDPEQFTRLQQFAHRDKVEVLASALSSFVGTVAFQDVGDASSKVDSQGTTQAPCTTLDALLSDTVPTLIKMDVEGHELEVLKGASATIAAHAPVLAVCAYHTADHLWQIPQLIHRLNPDYKIYLRRYAEDCWETVYYAVPPHRMVQ